MQLLRGEKRIAQQPFRQQLNLTTGNSLSPLRRTCSDGSNKKNNKKE